MADVGFTYSLDGTWIEMIKTCSYEGAWIVKTTNARIHFMRLAGKYCS